MSDPEGRFEPISWSREPSDPVPVCPTCNGLLRRLVTDKTVAWVCDLHGHVEPEWVDRWESEEDER